MTAILTEVLGRRVVASDTAEEIGEVKAVVADRTGRRFTAIHVAGRRRSAELVDWNDITAIGSDAVMVTSAGAVTGVPDQRAEDAVKGAIDYLGATVLSTDGVVLGTVSDVHFDEAGGTVVGLLTKDGRIEGDRIRGLGTFAAVVDAA